MAVVSTVKLSKLARHNRIDADRYYTDFLELEGRLASMPTTRKLRFLTVEPVRTGHTPADRQIREDDDKVRFVKTDTLREGLIDFENSEFLPARSLSRRDYLRDKDVIVTIIGAHYDIIGRAAIYVRHYPKSTVNQNIAVIGPDENLLSPFYLTVLLNSKYGKEQLWMLSRQTEQVNLNCREVEELLVPLFTADFQRDVETLAMQHSQRIEKSKLLYSQAENMLLEELGLKDFKPKYEHSYTANLSKAFRAHRVDAEYFQPAYEQVIEHINDRGVCTIRQIQAFNRRGVQPIYVEDGEIRVVTSKNLGRDSIDYWSLDKTTHGEWEKNKDARITKFDILTYTTGAYVGRTNCYLEDVKAIASNHVNILRVKGINPVFVGVYLNSVLGQLQVKRCVSGSAQAELYPLDISKFIVWKAPERIQDEIASLVQQSHEARRKAKALLEKAKRKVEQAIDGMSKLQD